MLPGKVYEVLPYVYIIGGIGAMVYFDTWLAMIPGVYIAMAGAVIWVLRSNNRRSDIKDAMNKYGGTLPFWLYELLPFVYVVFSILLIVLSDNVYLYPFAVILIGMGAQLWMLRRSYRKHQRPVSPIKKFNPMRPRS